MRKATLKTYTKNKLMEYYKKPLRFKEMLLDSQNDERLAEVAQAYYLAWNYEEKGNAFSFKTKATFTYKTFLESSQKYVRQFYSEQQNHLLAKLQVKDFIKQKMQEKNVSYYALAKHLQTSQSNVDSYFKKDIDNKLSYEQLKKLKKFLSYL